MRQLNRIAGLDAARGVIMLIMATDHVNALVVRRHSTEFWAGLWTRYSDSSADITQLVFRVLSDLCAPGFFFWMGSGLALLATRRTEWTRQQLRKHVVLRGLVLVLLSYVAEVPAWLIGILGDHTGSHLGGWPGAGPAIYLPVTVLTTLGICTILAAVLQDLLRCRAATMCVGLVCIAASSLLLPTDPDQPLSIVYRLGIAAGQTGHVYVEYPVLPWFGITLLGYVFGSYLAQSPERTLRAALWFGVTCVCLGILLRLDGGFGNIRLPRDNSWREFFNLIKYPPSLVFILLMTGLNLLIFFLLSHSSNTLMSKILCMFGRAPLIFYIAHLWLFAAIGALFFPRGTSYLIGVMVWFFGMLILYWTCRYFSQMRRASNANSILHLL